MMGLGGLAGTVVVFRCGMEWEAKQDSVGQGSAESGSAARGEPQVWGGRPGRLPSQEGACSLFPAQEAGLPQSLG